MVLKPDILKEIEIFSDLGEEEIAVLRSVMNEHAIQEGDVLFRQNQEGSEVYIVLDGSIGISVKLPDGKELEISEVRSGNFFGEMSIFEDSHRSATCRAKEKSLLLSLHKNEFFRLMETHSSIAARILYRMLVITTSRLKNTGNFLSDMVQWGEEARKRAITDDFTGLYNRRFLEDALNEQLSEARVRRQKLSLAMVDLDHFGTLNKEYGEKKGDEVILAAVTVFNTVFRDGGILVRYGGDEFTFILPRTDAAEALSKCEKVCSGLRELPVLDGMPGSIRRLTSSIGIACFPDHGESMAALLERADKALYKAKEAGRNRVAVAD